MGQTLSEPIKEKQSSSEGDQRVIYAASAMQGWRISMEDAHTTLLELAGHQGYSFFAVYDGHGGPNVAKYSGTHLHERIAKDEAFSKGNFHKAIINGFLGTDEDLKKDPQYASDPSGCTAVIALITPDQKIIVGNAGDSRAVLSVKGEAQEMSKDHKPVNKEESTRIRKAGGFVEFGRVNGNLALSRAVGDFEFKQNTNLPAEEQIVTALPEIKEFTLNNDTEFLVLACDGIWDCLSSQNVISFIRKEIGERNNLKVACENLMDHCLANDSELGGIGCDNMTVIIVGFLHGKTEKQWYEWIADRVEKGIGPIMTVDEKPPKQYSGYGALHEPTELEEDLTIPSEQITDDYSLSDNISNLSKSIDVPENISTTNNDDHFKSDIIESPKKLSGETEVISPLKEDKSDAKVTVGHGSDWKHTLS
ncbi:hypothetical protein G9A89_014145 [Geosiphon pyriformis]|nr:hypothetical protein G9A89_014145 [Geosiphon pyriformis]